MSDIFDKKQTRFSREELSTWALRIMTYVVIVVFFLIIGRIVYKGVPAIVKAGMVKASDSDFTFSKKTVQQADTTEAETWKDKIKLPRFFFQKPTIIYGFYDENRDYHRLTADEFRTYKKENKDGLIIYQKSSNYSGGGIMSPLIGTILLILICVVVAMSIGIASAVFLSEYSKRGGFIRLVRLAIINLAGVPSIVYGLFGVAFFCYFFPVITKSAPIERAFISAEIPQFLYQWISILPFIDDTVKSEQWYFSFQGWGSCMLAAGVTLACMVLPIVITACEESLRAVPQGFRDASLALGATSWQTIRKAVLPYALPGMLTASVLGVLRVAGETAPIMYTGAFATGSLPWKGLEQSNWVWKSFEFLQRGVEAMPYHIYVVASKIPPTELAEDMQNGAVLVFMCIVMALATASVILRMKVRKGLKW